MLPPPPPPLLSAILCYCWNNSVGGGSTNIVWMKSLGLVATPCYLIRPVCTVDCVGVYLRDEECWWISLSLSLSLSRRPPLLTCQVTSEPETRNRDTSDCRTFPFPDRDQATCTDINSIIYSDVLNRISRTL